MNHLGEFGTFNEYLDPGMELAPVGAPTGPRALKNIGPRNVPIPAASHRDRSGAAHRNAVVNGIGAGMRTFNGGGRGGTITGSGVIARPVDVIHKERGKAARVRRRTRSQALRAGVAGVGDVKGENEL
jgi:hypothetical protein